MNVLVSGVAGFIGSNFVYSVLKNSPDINIIGLDSLTYAGNLENLAAIPPDQKHFRFIKGDIGDAKLIAWLFEEHSIEGVINFAAESHVDRSIEDPHLFLQTNVLGTQTLLNAARTFWQKEGRFKDGVRFLQISTDEVYGSLGPTGLFTETTPISPRSPYSASKAAADMIVLAAWETYGLPVLVTRCSNNYGPFQFPEKLIPLIINNALQHKNLPVYGDGLNIRDWLYVSEHCDAIDLVFNRGTIGNVYNIGGNNECTNIDLIRKLLAILSEQTGDSAINESLITFVTDRPGHDRRYGIDATLIKREMGWQTAVGIDEGLSKTVEWYLANNRWLSDVVSGDYMKYYETHYNERD